jgi:hypothetical protein
MLLGALIGILVAQNPVLGIDGDTFTLDGKKTFLLGISYYGALGIEDEEIFAGDLDEMKTRGFNWVRVWATWNGYENNVCAVAPDGQTRSPYMERLKRLCVLAGERGMVVDVSVVRGDGPDYPSGMAEHTRVIETLARALLPYRNVYIDVGNERNIGDARHVPMEEVKQLIALIKAIDPKRLCTASQGGDISEEELREYLTVGGVDFISPHRGRHAGSASETGEQTRRYFKMMEGLRRVPVHYQEPFRRGYDSWEPGLSDFTADLEGAKAAGAAGWCFHNGSVRKSGDPTKGRPRRSFDLRTEEGRLFEQLDGVEREFVEKLRINN